ncbi:alport syndrome [Pisolithus sp. B1]|nr:alport syndrome [Pisolithus sp. B1]
MSLLPVAGETTVEDDSTCTKAHCFHAFDALYCALTDSTPIPPDFPDEKFHFLCKDGIAEYALISAFKDSRFSRIEEKELPFLECCVSLLTNFEEASSYLDWTIGTHGIYISFPDPALYPTSRSSSSASSPFSSSSFLPRFAPRRTLTATYLPDVIPAQGWDKIEAVESAMRKAGWAGPISEDTRRSVKLRRYQSAKCTVVWDDFVQWRRDNGDDTI